MISAFTRVHSPSKTGVNALIDALLPAHDADRRVIQRNRDSPTCELLARLTRPRSVRAIFSVVASPSWGVDEREWQSGKTLRRRSNCGHIHFN